MRQPDSKIDSWYWWRGRIEQSKEVLLVIKTSFGQLGKLREQLKANHSYETPELIAVAIHWGDRPYLDWLDQAIRPSKKIIENSLE